MVWRHSYQQGGNWYSTVMSNRFAFGVGWGSAAPATSDDNISGNTPPEVAVDANGNAVAIWEAYATGNPFREMHAATWNGGTWSATARLDPVGSNASDTPKVVMTGGGNAIAVWAELDGVFRIMTSTLQNGAWSPATIAAAPVGTAARYPRFAVDGARVLVDGRGVVPGDPARLALITLRPDGRAEMTTTDAVGEFPKADPRRAGLKRSLTAHTAGESRGRPLPTGLAIHDWDAGRSDAFEFGVHQVVEETVFVPKPGATMRTGVSAVPTRSPFTVTVPIVEAELMTPFVPNTASTEWIEPPIVTLPILPP